MKYIKSVGTIALAFIAMLNMQFAFASSDSATTMSQKLALSSDLPEEIRMYVDENIDELISTAKYFSNDEELNALLKKVEKGYGNVSFGGGYEEIIFDPLKPDGIPDSIFEIRDTDPRALNCYLFILYVDNSPAFPFEVMMLNGEIRFGTFSFSAESAGNFEAAVNALQGEKGTTYVSGMNAGVFVVYKIDGETELAVRTGSERNGNFVVFEARDFAEHIYTVFKADIDRLKEFKKENGYAEDDVILGGMPDLSDFTPTHIVHSGGRYAAVIVSVAAGALIIAAAGGYILHRKKQAAK